MRAHASLFVASLALVACSSKSSSSASVPDFPPIDDPDAMPRYLPDLSLSERKKLCDWTAAIGGGYGHAVTCDGGVEVSTFKDQATCLGEYIGACQSVTLDQYVACRKKEASDFCALYMYNSDECKPIVHCIGKTDGGDPPPDDAGGE